MNIQKIFNHFDFILLYVLHTYIFEKSVPHFIIENGLMYPKTTGNGQAYIGYFLDRLHVKISFIQKKRAQ